MKKQHKLNRAACRISGKVNDIPSEHLPPYLRSPVFIIGGSE
jgi:hypothetical protein